MKGANIPQTEVSLVIFIGIVGVCGGETAEKGSSVWKRNATLTPAGQQM